ncbi:MAG: hypothetical protein HY671_04970 [Chloroflexi bacterium]|nr:hypothetical protein [Chloroflexota bacterium]
MQFEQPPGTEVSTRQFSPGAQFRISGKVTGSLGMPNPFMQVRLDIHDGFPPLFRETYTNLLGNYSFDVTLPYVVGQASLVLTAWFPVGGAEQVTIPIGLGMEPAPLPAPGPDMLSSLMGLMVLVLVMSMMGSVLPMVKGLGPVTATSKGGGS